MSSTIAVSNEWSQQEAAQNGISMTEKSVAEVIYILLERYDRSIALVTGYSIVLALLTKRPCLWSDLRKGQAFRQEPLLDCLQYE